MNLVQLSEQYLEAADRLQERMAALRAAQPLARGKDALDLERRIEALYAELRDLRVVRNHLLHYYDD